MGATLGRRTSTTLRVATRGRAELAAVTAAFGATLVGALLLLAGALPTVAHAAVPWSSPETVFDDERSSPGAVVFSRDGRALIAQSHGYALAGEEPRVELATRTPAGRYRTFREVSGESPQVVAYGQTRAVLLRYLVEGEAVNTGGIARVGVSYGRTSGDIDPVKVIDRFRVFFDGPPLMAASEDGRIAIVYNDRTEGTEALRLAVREPGGEFEQRAIGPPGAEDVALDVGANGDIVVAWREDEFYRRDSGRIKARVQRRGHGLGRVEDLGPGETTTTLDASVADDGHVTVAWSAVDFFATTRGSSGVNSPVVVRAAVRPPGPHPFEPTQTLYDSGEPTEVVTDLAVDSSASAATVAWTANERDAQGLTRFSIQIATTDAGRRFGAPTPIALDGSLVVAPDGSATATWTPLRRDQERDYVYDDGLLAAFRPGAALSFGPTETVSDERAYDGRLALNPRDGRPTVVWNGPGNRTPSGVTDRLRVSTRD